MKNRFLSMLIGAVLFVLSVAAENYPYRSDVLWVTVPDHADWLYKTGEKAKIEVQFYKYGVPQDGVEVLYELGGDMMPSDTKGTVKLKNGKAVISMGTMKEPGFRDCRLTAKVGGKTYSHHIKVGFSPEKLQPYTQLPSDFNEFWNLHRLINRNQLNIYITMRTKTIYFFSLFLAITMMTGCFHISSGPKPSKSKMTKKYSVTPFNKIENKAPANIVFTQGNVTKVEADGPDNYIPQLIVMVKDSTLSISMDKDKFKNFKSSKINISITSPVLCSIKQRGVGSIYLKDSVKVTDLSISAEGVGSIEANALMARSIKVSQEGVGSINLKGQAGHATYYLEGVGSLKAKDMIVSDVVVEQNGVGSVSCYASGTINISAQGVGSVNYYGDPQVTGLKKSGIGSVKSK